MVRVKLDITDAQFFNDAQNKRESVRIYQVKPVLPHWIEEWDSVNGKARVWVKIPNIPAGGSVEIKMYYGNANAQDLSNGHAVFEYADPEPTVTIGTEQPSDAGGWQYMRKITITNPGTTDLTDFQVAINLDQSNFDFSKAQSTGADVRFVIEDPSPYKASYYIEEWDPSTPRATIWVALDENDPDFYIEVNPSNNTDDSDVSVMNLPESDVHTVISKFVRENV